MKYTLLIFTLLVTSCIYSYGQKKKQIISGKSKAIKFEIPKPYVHVEKALFNSNDNFQRNNPIYLKLFVKNSGGYIAKDVKVSFKFLYKNCFTLSDTNLFIIGNLKKGESKTVEYVFTANSNYILDKISLKADLTESNGKCARDTTLSVKLSKEPTDLANNQLRGGGDPLKGLNISKAIKEIQIGNYFSLIIGIDDYKGSWMPLNNAVRDAKAVENILKTNYKFNNFRTLYNEVATRKNIIKELEWLVENVKENDNVFIYYSGHGEFKKELKKGFWIPVDADIQSTYDYVSNSDIQTFLAAIKSKHTLLISDACFSGDIFRGKTISVPFEDSEKYYKKVHNLKSRQAITSGGVEPVMDGGSEGHSVFTYYLLKALKNSETKYYDAGQLYNDIKIPVTNNSDQSPILQPIKNTGDEGGQFIFIRK